LTDLRLDLLLDLLARTRWNGVSRHRGKGDAGGFKARRRMPLGGWSRCARQGERSVRSDFVTCVREGFKWLGGVLETRADLHEPPFQSTQVGCQLGCKWAQGFGARFKCSTRSGIMEICEAREGASEEELRWATSDEDEEFEQATPPRPSEVSRHSPRSRCVQQEGESESEDCYMATSDEDAPNEGVVRGDEAEAARGHLETNEKQVSLDWVG